MLLKHASFKSRGERHFELDKMGDFVLVVQYYRYARARYILTVASKVAYASHAEILIDDRETVIDLLLARGFLKKSDQKR